jgi:putative transposase
VSTWGLPQPGSRAYCLVGGTPSGIVRYTTDGAGVCVLCAIMDWATRQELAWRISTTLTTDFCIDAIKEALHRYGAREIFNTDQGAQFTSAAFVGGLRAHDIQISMDGRGCWRDNVFVERLWRSVKYEEVYPLAYETGADVRHGLTRYFTFFNERRPHQALSSATSDMMYFQEASTNTAVSSCGRAPKKAA